MSTKLYNGLKADLTTMAEFSILKKELKNLVNRFYVGKFETLVLSTYETYIKTILMRKHACNLFVESFANASGFIMPEEQDAFKKYENVFERKLNFAEKALENTNIKDDVYYKALILIAINETVSIIVQQYDDGLLNIPKEDNDLEELKTIVFIYPMEDKCLLYPIDSSYKKNGKDIEIVAELLKFSLISDYHYQNNSDKPDNVTSNEWKKRIKDWNIALDVENNPLGFLSNGIKVESNNFNALPIKRFRFSGTVKEDVTELLNQVNFDGVLLTIKDEIIFQTEFLNKKSTQSKISKMMGNLMEFKKNKEKYYKQYETLDNKINHLL